MDLKDLKACVGLVLPMQCDTRSCEFTEEAMKSLLEATQHKVPLQELQVVYEQSGDFDQTALALEHLRWDCAWSLFCYSIFLSSLIKFGAHFCNPILFPLLCLGFFINTFGGRGMRKMKMMILTTLFVVWSLVSGCEYTLCLSNGVFIQL